MADRKLSFLLTGGVDNRTADEFTAPVVQQGSAPKLKKSINTRLSVVPGGIVRPPPISDILTTGTNGKRGLVSAAHGSSTLVLPGTSVAAPTRSIVDAGRQQLVTTTWAPVRTPADNHAPMQARVLPVRVVKSGVAGAGKTVSQYASTSSIVAGAVVTVWWAHDGIPTSPSEYRLYAMVMNTSGMQLVPPTVIHSQATLPSQWLGVTAQFTGDCVWYVDTAGNAVYRVLTITGGGTSNMALSASAAVVVTALGNTAYGIAVCKGDGSSYAYLAHSKSGAATTGTLRRVDTSAGGATSWSVDFALALNGGGWAAVAYADINSAQRVAVAFSAVTGSAATLSVRDTAGAAVGTTKTPACTGRVALDFCRNGGQPLVSVVLEDKRALGTTNVVGVDHYTLDYGADTLSAVAFLGWHRIVGASVRWAESATMVHAVHQLVPRHNDANESPGAADYVDDPSLDLYICRSSDAAAANQALNLLCRVGVVRGTSAPADHLYTGQLSSQSAVVIGSQLQVLYRLLDDYSATADGEARGRKTVIELGEAAGQLATVNDKDGAGFIAGALPMSWDGCNLLEFGGPSHTPRLTATVVGAGGVVLPAGVYRFQAVLYWTDASGLVRRSRPSKLVTTAALNGATDRVQLHLARPQWLGTELVEARIYASVANGTTLHLMARVPQESSAVFMTYASVVTTANAQIYSSGGNKEEITPQPPPPAWDISIVGQRCWIVDAEQRSRAVPSKLRVAGVGYEFNPALEVIVPSGAGDLQAVREWQGLPLLITERAVWQVSGEGPSNTLGGNGSFSPPVKVSDLGCTNRASIVAFPGGLIWQSGSRFVLLDGQGVRYVSDFACTHDVSAGLFAQRYGEVYLFTVNTTGDTIWETRVFHPESGRWHTLNFTSGVSPGILNAHVLPWDSDAAILLDDSAGARRIDLALTGQATSQVVETDWMLLGGDFHDELELRWLVFNGRRDGAHDLLLELFLEYETGVVSTSRTYLDAEIQPLCSTTGHYSVKIEPQRGSCRALKVRITSTSAIGQSCSPRSCTLVYEAQSMLREDVFLQGSIK